MLLDGKKIRLRRLKSQVSAMIDGELPEAEKAALVNELKTNVELQKSWYRYHVIKTVLQKKNGKLMFSQANTLSKRVKAELAKMDFSSRALGFDTPIVMNTSHPATLLPIKDVKQG